jgi:FAD-dependent oxidoreductase domain-containing protein 1
VGRVDQSAVKTADVVIVGGGVIGSSIATLLAGDPAFNGSIIVLERDPAYRRSSSALSASSIRQQFSTPENIRMSRFGFEFLLDIGRRLGVDGSGEPPPDAGLTQRGYLYLAPPAGEAILRENHEIQLREGVDAALLTPDELAARFPWLSVDGVALGSLGLRGEGWFDGYGVMRAFRKKAESMAVTYRAAEAAAFRMTGRRVATIELAGGSTIACDAVVNAAGPWAAAVAAMAGVDLPVEARRRTVFTFEAAEPPEDMPLVIDTSGAWFRPEGGAFIGAIPPPEEDDAPDLPLEADQDMWEGTLWPAIAARVPSFDSVRRIGAWAGYYEYNTFDHNAILGAHPEVTNLYFANGFSGHGIQQAPAVGRAIAELITYGRYVSLDLSVFGYERIAAGRPVLERNVIG